MCINKHIKKCALISMYLYELYRLLYVIIYYKIVSTETKDSSFENNFQWIRRQLMNKSVYVKYV